MVVYPDYELVLLESMQTRCSSQLDFYRTHSGTVTNTSEAIVPFIDCMLGYVTKTCRFAQPLRTVVAVRAMNETKKVNMAAAAVLLGLLPTILSMIGTTTTETGLLSLRRPVLVSTSPALRHGTPC
jgi:hypothetical protein